MKKVLIALTVFCVFGLAQAQDDLGQHVPLAEFGPGGMFEPNFMGDALPDQFYNTYRSKSVANGLNYVGLVENLFGRGEESVGKADIRSDRDIDPLDRVMNDPFLSLMNDSDKRVNVVVSLTNDLGATRNFLVTLPEYDGFLISLSGFNGYSDMTLISHDNFSARLLEANSKAPQVIQLQAPRQSAAKATCAFCTAGYIEVDMGSWNAHVYRHQYSSSVWHIRVDYPNPGDAFHNPVSSSTYGSPACKIKSATTVKYDNTKQFRWVGFSTSSLDDALFDDDKLGEAYCQGGGCNGTNEFYIFKREFGDNGCTLY